MMNKKYGNYFRITVRVNAVGDMVNGHSRISEFYIAHNMTSIDALSQCNLPEETMEELRRYITLLEESDELCLIHYPVHIENLIKILINPDAILVVNIRGEHIAFLDRVLIYKNNIRCRLSSGFPNEYTFLRMLIGEIY